MVNLHHSGWGRVDAIVGRLARSRPLWVFGAIWAGAVLVLVGADEGVPVVSLLLAAGFGVWCIATLALTEPDRQPTVPTGGRRRLWLQLAVILGFVILTAWAGLAFHGVVGAEAAIPLWSAMVGRFNRLGESWLGNGNFVANPMTYLVLPLSALVVLRAHPRELGFGRGHRVGRVVVSWCAIPLGLFAFALTAGQITFVRLLERFASHFLQNGLMEEFLFRGALYTRLRLLTGVGWALVIQALLFGAWHLGLGYTDTGHAGLLPAMAAVTVNQAVAGLAFGVIFERTRNLIAPTAVHIVLNSLG